MLDHLTGRRHSLPNATASPQNTISFARDECATNPKHYRFAVVIGWRRFSAAVGVAGRLGGRWLRDGVSSGKPTCGIRAILMNSESTSFSLWTPSREQTRRFEKIQHHLRIDLKLSRIGTWISFMSPRGIL
ncbi:hypothetical protein QR680_018766 [Steinernema hermaphroditum]|uniref:Uncharacterized protein n=1 Tax=Steinernema hermaphroditum TaxID=289476 RepID=A0AA39LRI5_9BILA|nr:hypothetical protein QR680_018766 [Steinernema hermaphroditum]